MDKLDEMRGKGEIRIGKGYMGIDGLHLYSDTGYGPRGDYFEVLIFTREGKIKTGDEQGNYCGGVHAGELNFREAEEYAKRRPSMWEAWQRNLETVNDYIEKVGIKKE